MSPGTRLPWAPGRGSSPPQGAAMSGGSFRVLSLKAADPPHQSRDCHWMSSGGCLGHLSRRRGRERWRGCRGLLSLCPCPLWLESEVGGYHAGDSRQGHTRSPTEVAAICRSDARPASPSPFPHSGRPMAFILPRWRGAAPVTFQQVVRCYVWAQEGWVRTGVTRRSALRQVLC